MSIEVLIMVFILLCFCFATQILTIKLMFTLMSAKKTAENGDFSPIKLFDMPKRKAKKQKSEETEEQKRYETIMRNLEAYDGTGIGQEEVK